MYSLASKFLFLLNPEHSHHFSLKALRLAQRLKLLPCSKKTQNSFELLNLKFKNKVGLAAGLDKNAEYIDALAALGFGFIEVGTVTPKPQSGNPKPRLFRLTKDKAIINRMGFNNIGVAGMITNLKKTKYKGVLGINIGKNKDTPNDKATDDYLYCFNKLWPYASYVTINISSPNTKNLRDLQSAEALSKLLTTLKTEQTRIHKEHAKYVPLMVKIAPDLSPEEIKELAEAVLNTKIDGIIANNTSIRRENLNDHQQHEGGGLSGQPISKLSTDTIYELRKHLPRAFPIIASGGVMDKESAQAKFDAGADLVQVYTGFIYAGPSIISEIAKLYIA